MDRNQGNQGRRPNDMGGQKGPQSGSDSRNLGNMDDEEARRARREGSDMGSSEQDRDQPGTWSGTETTGTETGTPGGSTYGQGQGRENQGGSNR